MKSITVEFCFPAAFRDYHDSKLPAFIEALASELGGRIASLNVPPFDDQEPGKASRCGARVNFGESIRHDHVGDAVKFADELRKVFAAYVVPPGANSDRIAAIFSDPKEQLTLNVKLVFEGGIALAGG